LNDSSAPATQFPGEEVVLGFDNNADQQRISALLVEGYQSAALALSKAATLDLPALLACDPASQGEDACVAGFVNDFGLRAYRRPLAAEETSRLLAFYAKSKVAFDFPTAVRLLLQAMLQSPHFLYRVETQGTPVSATVVKVSGYQLASRLSYLLWSSTPDLPLLKAAAAGTLDTPEGIKSQAERMLADRRAKRAVASFFAQWLDFEKIAKLGNSDKNAAVFATFTPGVASLLRREAELFVDDVFFSGGDVSTLAIRELHVHEPGPRRVLWDERAQRHGLREGAARPAAACWRPHPRRLPRVARVLGTGTAGLGGRGSSGGVSGSAGRGGETTGGSGASGGVSTGGVGAAPASCQSSVAAAAAPSPHWVNATGNLAGKPARCASLGKVLAQPCSKRIVAGVEGAGLFASDDAGKSWQPLGVAAGSAAITNSVTNIVFDPVHPEILWETGIRGESGLYVSNDDGATFRELGKLSFTQTVSVDFSDPERKTLVTGTHGIPQQVFLSRDSGKTWSNIGLNLPADSYAGETPLVLDSQTFLLGGNRGGVGDQSGIYRTTNAGASWEPVGSVQVNHFGVPLQATDGSIYWPLYATGGMAKSTDLGLTWTKLAESALHGVSPIELPDSSIVTIGTDHLVRSADGGATWQPLGEALPFQLVGDGATLTYSAALKTFFVSHSDCASGSVGPDAIVSAGFDYAL
jgi:photosystem II stability/assembly factor-like uncharacterized protein